MIGVMWGLNNKEALLNAGLPEKNIIYTPYEMPSKIKNLEKN